MLTRSSPFTGRCLPGVDGEGLLLEPKGKVVAQVVALPDADWTPEMVVGLTAGVPEKAQFARRLAENGCRVIVPVLIDRKDTWSGNLTLGRMTNQPHREFIYRMAYEMGRHLLGYEVQKVLAAVDWFCREKDHPPVGVMGYAEGGLLALYSAALDMRIHSTAVCGYFGPREAVWEEPIYHNVFGLLREFGDAELCGLISPRHLHLQGGKAPAIVGPPASRPGRGGAAPGRLNTPNGEAFLAEGERAAQHYKRKQGKIVAHSRLTLAGSGREELPLDELTYKAFLATFDPSLQPQPSLPLPTDKRQNFDPASRQKRQFDQLVAFTQQVMRNSERHRQQHFWAKLDTSSLEKYQKSCEPFRKQLGEEVIGKLPAPSLPMNPQSRPIYDEPKWKGYEVTLDLYPDVFAYGILLLPKDLKPGEKRPVVVCQHGLEGRPTDVCNPKIENALLQLVRRPAGRSRLHRLRAAEPLHRPGQVPRPAAQGQSPWAIALLLHRPPARTDARLARHAAERRWRTAWRSTACPTAARRPCACRPCCRATACRSAPATLTSGYARTCRSIIRAVTCSAPEYEMPEFDLGQTFNYAEMAALIAPRPFMVERGHDDGVGIDEWVAYEYAKVRRLYSRLKIPERTEIEYFAGGHEIHSQGTFRFLQKHLKWPR